MALKYWVGGTDTWDGTAGLKWAATSGGAGGAAVPTSSDDVFIDSASGTGTCTIAAGAACSTLTVNSTVCAVTLGAGLTMASTCTFTQGTLSLATYTLSCGIFSSSNSNARTLAFGTGNITCTGAGGNLFACGNTANMVVTGTPVVNISYAGATAVSCGFGTLVEARAISFNFTAGTYTLTVNNANSAKNLNFTGFAGTWALTAVTLYGNLTLGSGMTVAGGASAITLAATSGTQTITSNGVTIDRPITINAPGATVQGVDAFNQGSTRAFTFTAGTLKLKNGATTTVGTFATSGATAKTLQSTVDGSQATLSQASGTVSVTNLTIKDIAATGGATWQAYGTNGNVNGGNNSGWQFLTPSQLAAINNGLSLRLGLGL